MMRLSVFLDSITLLKISLEIDSTGTMFYLLILACPATPGLINLTIISGSAIQKRSSLATTNSMQPVDYPLPRMRGLFSWTSR
jgi:hypothetical protein